MATARPDPNGGVIVSTNDSTEESLTLHEARQFKKALDDAIKAEESKRKTMPKGFYR